MKALKKAWIFLLLVCLSTAFTSGVLADDSDNSGSARAKRIATLEVVVDSLPDVTSIENFSEGLAVASLSSGDRVVIDTDGNIVLNLSELGYSAYGGARFSYGLLPVYSIEKNNNNCGYINCEGELVIPCEYDYINNFSEGYALVEWYDDTPGEWYDERLHCALIDTDGEIYREFPIYERGNSSFDYLYSLTTASGETCYVNCHTRDAGTDGFNDGLMPVRDVSGNYGFVNTALELVLPCDYYLFDTLMEYAWGSGFFCGYARCYDFDADYSFWIDTDGNTYSECPYDAEFDAYTDEEYIGFVPTVQYIGQGIYYCYVAESDHWVYVDATGRELTDDIYLAFFSAIGDTIVVRSYGFYYDDYAAFETDNGYGILKLTTRTSGGSSSGGTDAAIPGDLNGDGEVNAGDLTILARHVGKVETMEDETCLANADVTGDGSVDASDLTKLAQYVGKIISSLD
ncbi:MAG: dockerin type I domain-containing protein [Oscillospiraceae bacterium]|nr:dockerin type I domain-containing protein [Oscillospiraceae bacterium]